MANHREEKLSQTFVELADTLVDDFDVADLLHTLTTRCVEIFEVDAAGLVIADARGALRVLGSSSEQSRTLEVFELQTQDGPCLDCYRTGEPVVEADLSSTERWPQFRPEALNAGYRAVMALPMTLRGRTIGALNLFRAEPGTLTPADISASQALADVATIALLQDRAVREARVLAEQLQIALNSRVVIEQAKGMLAEQARIDLDTAFRVLRAYARRNNRLLVDVTRALLEGELSADDLEVPSS